MFQAIIFQIEFTEATRTFSKIDEAIGDDFVSYSVEVSLTITRFLAANVCFRKMERKFYPFVKVR